MDHQSVLLGLLRVAVCGEAATEQLKNACTQSTLENVYALAVRHDLAHLVGQAVSKLDLPDSEILQKCKQTAMQAMMRYVQLSYEYEQVCQVLEQAQIPFIPLKGSVLRNNYPEPWMRTSCDTDILVKEEHLDTATACLVEKLNYTAGGKSDHDVSLYTPTGAHLELHYDTIQERYEVGGCREVLAQIWDHAAPREQGSCHLWLTDEMFYFYHMAHMAKHFEVGGCGIRTFLDIWIMNHKMPHDRQKRSLLLQEGGLLQFAQAAERVSEYWFCGAEPDQMDIVISDYILRASLYGDNANRAALGQAKNGGRLKYLLTQRVFMPYNYLKDEYPILKRYKWLTPVYQPIRWVRMLRSGGLGRTLAELKANAAPTDTHTAADILKHLGL